MTRRGNRSVTLRLRVTEEEAERLRWLAERAGLTLSEYLRRRGLLRSVSKESK